jgi:AcrR family transcriptional regulator
VGWHGLTFDAVFKQAGVGKSALYLRWPTKERLLVDALAARTVSLTLIDTGSVREDLLNFARQIAAFYLGQNGLVTLRVFLEALTRPELLASIQQQRSTSILAARAIVHRGVARGELPEGTSATLVTDIVAGAVLNHVLATPLSLREQMVQQLDRYVEDLVDFVLTNAQSQRIS